MKAKAVLFFAGGLLPLLISFFLIGSIQSSRWCASTQLKSSMDGDTLVVEADNDIDEITRFGLFMAHKNPCQDSTSSERCRRTRRIGGYINDWKQTIKNYDLNDGSARSKALDKFNTLKSGATFTAVFLIIVCVLLIAIAVLTFTMALAPNWLWLKWPLLIARVVCLLLMVAALTTFAATIPSDENKVSANEHHSYANVKFKWSGVFLFDIGFRVTILALFLLALDIYLFVKYSLRVSAGEGEYVDVSDSRDGTIEESLFFVPDFDGEELKSAQQFFVEHQHAERVSYYSVGVSSHRFFVEWRRTVMDVFLPQETRYAAVRNNYFIAIIVALYSFLSSRLFPPATSTTAHHSMLIDEISDVRITLHRRDQMILRIAKIAYFFILLGVLDAFRFFIDGRLYVFGWSTFFLMHAVAFLLVIVAMWYIAKEEKQDFSERHRRVQPTAIEKSAANAEVEKGIRLPIFAFVIIGCIFAVLAPVWYAEAAADDVANDIAPIESLWISVVAGFILCCLMYFFVVRLGSLSQDYCAIHVSGVRPVSAFVSVKQAEMTRQEILRSLEARRASAGGVVSPLRFEEHQPHQRSHQHREEAAEGRARHRGHRHAGEGAAAVDPPVVTTPLPSGGAPSA